MIENIPFPEPRLSDALIETGFSSDTFEIPEVRWGLNDDRSAQPFVGMPIDDLYPLRDTLKPELTTAFRLLDETLERIKDAIDAQRRDDLIASDDALQRLQMLLPELFCCRTLGDGFGAIINAIYHGLRNRQGQPLQKNQVIAIGQALRKIRSEPFLEFEEAVEHIMAMEDTELMVEPAEFEYLQDLLSE